MPDALSNDDDREQQLDSIIGRYYMATEQGHAPDQDQIVTQHPQFERELREFFADLGNLQGVIPPVEENPILHDTISMKDPPTQLPHPGSTVRYIGEYEILNELGVGGMGVVYKARQSKLRRIVALKMIRSGELANPQDVQRFQAEAKAVSRLLHPGIVAIHEVGIHKGQHFYTMDFVGGGSLSNLHRDEPVPAQRAADLVRQLAEAVHYAHGEGIVHRDLKPANILLTENGAPRITDFGLAKSMWNDDGSIGSSMTETGQILGTAGYMSPEQATGKSKLVGPAADIYSLGAVLYALLTSRAPFVGESKADTIMQVIHKEPVSPRMLNPSVPLDLETICLKCLEKEPHKRYGTAQLLADDLARFVEGRPVLARPINGVARTWRWCRRNPLVAGLSATVAASMLIGTAVSWYFADQSRLRANANYQLAGKEREARLLADQRKGESDRNASLAEARRIAADKSAKLAETRREEALANSDLARRHLYCAHMGLVQKAWDENRISAVLNLLERHRPKEGVIDLRGFEWHYWMRRCRSELFSLPSTTRAAYGPQGATIVTLSKGAFSFHEASSGKFIRSTGSLKGLGHKHVFNADATLMASRGNGPQIAIWDTATGAKLHEFVGQSRSFTFGPDGRTLATANKDGSICLWNTSSGTVEMTLEANVEASGTLGDAEFAFSPDGRRIAAAYNHDIKVWDLESRQVILKLNGIYEPIHHVLYSPDGISIAAAAGDGHVILWDAKTGQSLWTRHGHSNKLMGIAFNSDGTQLATGSADRVLTIWDTTSGRKLRSFKGHLHSVTTVAFSADGTRVLSSSVDGTTKVWDALNNGETPSLASPVFGVTSVAAGSDGSRLVVGGGDERVAVLNLRNGTSFVRMNQSGFGSGVDECRVAIKRDGSAVASCQGKLVRIWNAETGELQRTLSGQEYESTCCALSPDEARIVAGAHDGKTIIWDAATGRILQRLSGHKRRVHDVIFTHDGTQIISVDEDGLGLIRDIAGDRIDRRWNTRFCQRLRLSPTGKILATTNGNEVTLWDLETLTETLTLVGHSGTIHDVVFSPDSTRIATAAGYGDGTIKLWDATTGEETLSLKAEAREACAVIFSPDGLRLISGHDDGSIHFWDTSRHEQGLATESSTQPLPSRILLRLGRELTSVTHSADGKLALTGGIDHTARLWDLTTGEERQVFKGHDEAVRDVAITADGKTAITASDDRTIRFWDLATGKQQCQFAGKSNFTKIRLSQDGKLLLSANADGRLRIWTISEPELRSEFVYTTPIVDMAMRTQLGNVTEYLIVGTESGKILVCDHQSGSVLYPLIGHTDAASSLAALNSEYVLSGSHDNSIRLWNIGAQRSEAIFRGHTAGVNEVRRLPGGRRFVSCSVDRTVRLWDLDSGLEIARGSSGSKICGVSIAPDGGSCLTASLDGTLQLWDLPRSTPASLDGRERVWLTMKEFQIDFEEKRDRKLRPVEVFIGLDPATNQLRFSALWERGTNRSFIVRHALSDAELENAKRQHSNQGYELSKLKTQAVNGVNFHIALWVKK